MKRTYKTNIQIGEELTILLNEADWKRWAKKNLDCPEYYSPHTYPVLASLVDDFLPSYITLKEAVKLTDTIRSAYCAMESASLEGKK